MSFTSLRIYSGQTLSYDAFLTQLAGFGYARVPNVGEPGDLAFRGEVVDLYPVTFDHPLRVVLNAETVEQIYSFDVLSGEVFERHQAVIILPVTGVRKKRIRVPYSFAEEIPVDNFVDIDPGDYVVHIKHGIGIYRGVERLAARGRYVNHFVIEYRDCERLFVPEQDLHLIHKYLSFGGIPPKVHKLGGTAWEREKQRSRTGVYALAAEFIELQAKRAAFGGNAFSADTDWQREMEEAFPFQETPDQVRATCEVKKDMERPVAMDRLLCGDVGYGKTEVALRAAFKAVMDNKQVAVLVPTTILAEQHYATFTRRVAPYPVSVAMLSRFRTAREQDRILARLAEGAVDVIIGTHRLLSDDVVFKDLGLIIIDEEQRFGVRHKERLKRLRLQVDVLTLTATPIPRTLYLSLMGARDMSVINTPPATRVPIHTEVAEYQEDLIRQALERERARGGQAYFVHNRVQGIEKVAHTVAGLVPGSRVAIAHGQMTEHLLEETIVKFMRAEIDILVCTSIIESGIDIPNANTLIVNRADMFGLSDLYQLKGRVGRFDREAYAYFLVPKARALTREADKRLQSLQEHTALGAGFRIAMEDLQIRGAGNLLGVEQHGFIRTIGFDLYCRLLREAVNVYRQEGKTASPQIRAF